MEYNAASDAYTNAPEDFKELYNQVSHRLNHRLADEEVSLTSV